MPPTATLASRCLQAATAAAAAHSWHVPQHHLRRVGVVCTRRRFTTAAAATHAWHQHSTPSEQRQQQPQASQVVTHNKQAPWLRDHLDRTSDAQREDIVTDATITHVDLPSDTVTRVELHTVDPRFSFRPGQWVDVFIPSIDTVGGFSICSAPHQLPSLELAVKRPIVPHAPALWLGQQAAVGDSLQLRVGGDVWYSLHRDNGRVDRHLLLVAGGIGLNPLLSVLRDSCHWLQTPAGRASSARVTVLYSVRHADDLVYASELQRLAAATGNSRIRIVCFLSGEPAGTATAAGDTGLELQGGRISKEALRDAVGDSKPVCMVCGPPPMTDFVVEALSHVGVSSDNVLYEKWW